jgi:hypothetical protein
MRASQKSSKTLLRTAILGTFRDDDIILRLKKGNGRRQQNGSPPEQIRNAGHFGKAYSATVASHETVLIRIGKQKIRYGQISERRNCSVQKHFLSLRMKNNFEHLMRQKVLIIYQT